MLAVVGGAAGLLLARWSLALLVELAPAGLPRLGGVRVDAAVLGFALAASVVASLFFGVLPALHASRVDLQAALGRAGRGGPLASGGSRLRGALVVAEIALAVALVAGASLLARSLAALARVDLGFSADRVLVVETSVPARGDAGARHATAFYADLLPRLAAIPGVTSGAATVRCRPYITHVQRRDPRSLSPIVPARATTMDAMLGEAVAAPRFRRRSSARSRCWRWRSRSPASMA